MNNPEIQSPVNPLPPVVVALFLLIVGIEAVFSLGAKGFIGGPEALGWRLGAQQTYSFSPEIFAWMVESGLYPREHMMRFVTYLFVHGSLTHTLVASVMLLALGKMVGDIFSAFGTLAVFLLSGIGGALAYGIIQPSHYVLIGAMPGIYGLIGAFTFLLWAKLGRLGQSQSQAFMLIGMLLAIQLVFGLIFGGSGDWLADAFGFAIGFASSFVLAPGGWAHLRARLRRD